MVDKELPECNPYESSISRLSLQSSQLSCGPRGSCTGLLSAIGSGTNNINMGDHSFISGRNGRIAPQDDSSFMISSGEALFHSVGANTAALKTVGTLNLERYQPVEHLPLGGSMIGQKQVGTMIHLQDSGPGLSHYCSTVSYERRTEQGQPETTGSWSYFPNRPSDWKNITNYADNQIYPNMFAPGNISCALDILAHSISSTQTEHHSGNMKCHRIPFHDVPINSKGQILLYDLPPNTIIIEIRSALLVVLDIDFAMLTNCSSYSIVYVRGGLAIHDVCMNSKLNITGTKWVASPTIHQDGLLFQVTMRVVENSWLFEYPINMAGKQVRGYIEFNTMSLS